MSPTPSLPGGHSNQRRADLLSYNKDQAVGDDEHNIVTIIMKKSHLGVQDAIDKPGELSDQKMAQFVHLYSCWVALWVGTVDLDVQKLIHGMAMCVSGVALELCTQPTPSKQHQQHGG